MEARATKLTKALGVSAEIAALLVAADLPTENRAKQASVETLTAIEGIDEAMAATIRGQ